MPYLVGTDILGQVSGSYVREAWLDGLKTAEREGFDPFAFGVVGASDSHNASSGGSEDEYWGKFGMLDAEGTVRGSVPVSTAEDGAPVYHPDAPLITFSASGLAGVWAERNTRGRHLCIHAPQGNLRYQRHENKGSGSLRATNCRRSTAPA